MSTSEFTVTSPTPHDRISPRAEGLPAAESRGQRAIRHGKRARLYVVIVAVTVTRKGQIDTITRRPFTLRMVNRGGRWLLADNNFLAERAAVALALKGTSK